jgi:hypothetical protein
LLSNTEKAFEVRGCLEPIKATSIGEASLRFF